MSQPDDDPAGLKPSSPKKRNGSKDMMGVFGSINLLLACIIGSGIFISAKAVLEFSGSYGLSIVVWFGCGILCIMVKNILIY